MPTKSNLYDRIDLELTPYLKDPLKYVGDGEVQWIGLIAPTQSGKTVFLQGVIADAIDQDPGPLLYLLPDKNSTDKMIKEKVIDVIDNTPSLSKHKTERVRDVSKKGILLDNMTIYPAWAGSLATISSLPMKRVVLDEVRLMGLTIGTESNAIKLAADRLTTYWDHKVGQGYLVSSASVEGDLLHNQLSVPGTLVLYFHSKCLTCGEYQLLSAFKNLRKIDGKIECYCKYCRAPFNDKDKKKGFNQYGVYAPKDARIFKDGSLATPYKKHPRMIFRYGSMVSPFRSFETIYKELHMTKGKIHDFKNFVQCWEADFWIDDISKTDSLKLKEHKREYIRREVPQGVKVITVGVDTQDSGFYGVVRGHGKNNHTWVIDAFFYGCHIDVASIKDIKKVFKDILSRVYRTREGRPWTAAMLALDTGGHRTKDIYSALDNMSKVVMVKGAHDTQPLTITYNKDLNLYNVRTSEYLEETELRCEMDSWHLPENIQEDYLTQFCNARKIKDKNKKTGEEKIIWKKVGQNDYRMADIHSFICLDIPTDRGMFRSNIDKDDFQYNPSVVADKKIKKVQLEEEYDDEEEDFLDEDSDWLGATDDW